MGKDQNSKQQAQAQRQQQVQPQRKEKPQPKKGKKTTKEEGHAEMGSYESYPYNPVSYEMSNLPAPWVAVPDPNSGRLYYWNQLTNDVTWHPPQQQQQQQLVSSPSGTPCSSFRRS